LIDNDRGYQRLVSGTNPWILDEKVENEIRIYPTVHLIEALDRYFSKK
jgi:hypothetical protein